MGRLTFDRSLGVQLVDHTVKVGHSYAAGHLVRRSGTDLGYVWSVGNSWQWRTTTGAQYGERSSLNAALTVLCDIANLPRLPFVDDRLQSMSTPTISQMPLKATRRTVTAATAPTPRKPKAQPAPTKIPAPQVQWATDINPRDLRDAIAKQLDRYKR